MFYFTPKYRPSRKPVFKVSHCSRSIGKSEYTFLILGLCLDRKLNQMPNPLERIKKYHYCFSLLAVTLLTIWTYFWLEWRTFDGFVTAIDRGTQFMQDFVGHYYPMSIQILQNPVPVTGYYYPSFFAILLSPIGKLSQTEAMTVWGIIQFVCFISLCIFPGHRLLKLDKKEMIFFFFLCISSYPILNNIKWGQVSIPITLCVLAALFLSDNNKPVLAGILLGLATAIKFYPALFCVYFIFKRDLRALIAFGLATFVFYFAFPATILGFSGWLGFEKIILYDTSHTKFVTYDVNSQYFTHVALRWFELFFSQVPDAAFARVLKVLGYTIAASCIAMAWLLTRKATSEKYNLPIAAIFLSLPFLLDTSWPHYFAYLPYCQTAILAYIISRFRTSDIGFKILIILPAGSMLLSSIFLFNVFMNWSIYNTYGMLFLANLLLLSAIYAIIANQYHYFRLPKQVSQ